MNQYARGGVLSYPDSALYKQELFFRTSKPVISGEDWESIIIDHFNDKKLLKEAIYGSGGYIAGGYLLYIIAHQPGAVPHDIDVYFRSKVDNINGVVNYFKSVFNGDYDIAPRMEETGNVLLMIYRSNNGRPSQIKYGDIHLIFSHYGEMKEVVDNFDFTVCQIGYDFKNVYFGEKTKEDIRNNSLVLSSIHNPEKLYYRIVKYENKGFTPTDHTSFIKELFKPLAKEFSNRY